MIPRSTRIYVQTGDWIRLLSDVQVGYNLYGEIGLKREIQVLLKNIGFCGFKVTSQAARPLQDLISIWTSVEQDQINAGTDLEKWKLNQKLSEDDAKILRNTALKIRQTITYESNIIFAYILESRKYDSDKLLESVESLMPEGSFSKLSDLAKFDVKNAGRALAFDLPTASAFHILRATEDTVREFYEKVVTTNRIKEPRNWGNITTHITSIPNLIPKELIKQLDFVRENFRNPTQHPEKIYSLDEAEELFGLCVGLIARLQLHISANNL